MMRFRLLIPVFVLLIIFLALENRPSSADAPPTPDATSVTFGPDIQNAITAILQAHKFVAGTPMQAGVYVLDLASGNSLDVNPGKAFSAASVMKIAVMIAM